MRIMLFAVMSLLFFVLLASAHCFSAAAGREIRQGGTTCVSNIKKTRNVVIAVLR